MRTPNRPTVMKALLTLALAACPTPSRQSQLGDAGLWCPSVVVVDPLNAVQPSGPCVCTRRDAVPAGNCNRGTGESVSATIGPEGGTLTLEREPVDFRERQLPDRFSIRFPPGAILTPTLITVTELAEPPPSDMVDWSPMYRIEPVGLALEVLAEVEVRFSQGTGPAYGRPALFWSSSSDCRLERLPGSSIGVPTTDRIRAVNDINYGQVGRLGFAISGYAKKGDAQACSGGGSAGGGSAGGDGGWVLGTGGCGPGNVPGRDDLPFLESFSTCQRPGLPPAPFVTTFRFKNPNSQPITVQFGLDFPCERPLKLFNCAGQEISRSEPAIIREGPNGTAGTPLCAAYCDGPGLAEKVVVDVGGSVDINWSGTMRSTACSCQLLAMPEGRYTARKSFFGPDGGEKTADFAFTRTTDGGVVEVDLVW